MVINNWTPIKSFFADMVSSVGKWFSNLFGWFDKKIQSVGSVISKVKGLFGGDEKAVAVAIRPVSAPTMHIPSSASYRPANRAIPSVPTRSQSASNNVTVNISNPNFANKEHAAATQKQIDEQVRKALARHKNDKADRSYA